MMRKIVLLEYLSLDGVVQAPGHAGEDPSDGFEHGGWSGPFMTDHRDPVLECFDATDAFLLGRITYQIFADYWPTVTDPDDAIAHALNSRPKYVASTTLSDPSWHDTTVIGSAVPETVAELKRSPGKGLLVIGSSGLAQTLMEHDLVDEYRLMLHPVLLGRGKRLFRDSVPTSTLRLVDTRTSPSGLVNLTYRAQRAS